MAPWPKALHRFLRGRADVEVRDHADGTLVGAAAHVFRGNERRVVRVVNKNGTPLVLDKYGRLIRPLSAESEGGIDDLLEQCDRLLTVLRDEGGVPAFISYGTLLGAARSGKLIGHDNDVDLAYVSKHRHPVDVVRESYDMERLLTAKGWVARRGSGTRLNVRLPSRDGSLRFVDVFTAHWVDGVLYMPSDTGFEIPEDEILPLTTLELHGRPMPSPKNYELLLSLTYGDGWRVPDPSFKYDTPRWLERRLEGWFGALHPRRKEWDTFYATGSSRKLLAGPTKFARWVDQRYRSERTLVDLGTGTARDAKWFAVKKGRQVIGFDYSMSVLGRDLKLPRGAMLDRRPLNLADLRDVLALGHALSSRPEPVDLYGRFLLHALDDAGRANLLRLASMSLRRGGYLFLEFRTDQDRGRSHFFPRKNRTFVDPDDVVRGIQAAGGTIVERVEGTGLAPFQTEDPHVARIVASWSGTT